MSRAKVLISIVMVLILIALSGASVWAAPNGQDLISGVVDEIEIDEETNTVLVTLTDDLGETHKVRMSLDTAVQLGLVDDNGDPLVDIGDHIDIPLSDDIEVIDGEEGVHPVAWALFDFFKDALGLDYDTVMVYHEEDGMGFGVIAKACWMSYLLGDPDITVEAILQAKRDHTFSDLELPDGTTASNWGQFKKAVMASEKAQKNLNNLGAIMSGRAEKPDGTGGDELGAAANQGKKKGKGPGETGPPGKGKDKDKGGGPPAEPPGQDKKDKGGGGGGGGGGGKGKGK